MPRPITLIDAGGIPITNIGLASEVGAPEAEPMTPVDSGGEPFTLVEAGGYPVSLVNEGLTAWEAPA